ncbi:MAG: c-type cytochrome, partial [Sphingobacteriales bacterium]
MKPTGDYAGLEKSLNTPGKVTFKTKLNLYNMLRPNIQPGSTIDYSFPPEDVTLTFNSSDMLEIKAAGAIIEPSVKQGDAYITKVTFKQVERKPYDLEIAATSNKRFALNVTYSTAEDARPRALQVNRFFAPWLKDIFNSDREEIKDDPKLAGGNWAKGKKLFFGEALCSTCHNIGGKGKSIGPDLSNLVFRDYNSVLRDIHDPNASINPDYAASTITLKNKKLLEGMLSYKKDSVIVKAVTGVKTSVALKDIVSTKPLNRSLMYPGLDIMLGPQKMKDLLTFLLTNVSPARYEHIFLPPIRSSAEVNELLRNSADAPFAAAKSKAVKGKTVRPKVMPVIKTVKPFRILWVSGPKDHGADEHDYPLQQQRWSKLLSLAEDVTVTKANAWPTQQQFDNADVVVFYWNYQKFTEENGITH